MGSLIDCGDKVSGELIDTNGRNTYRRKITDLQSGNRGRDSEIMGGLLDNNKSKLKRCDGRS